MALEHIVVCGKMCKVSFADGGRMSPFHSWNKDEIHIHGALINMNHTKQAHKAHTNNLGRKMLHKWVLPMVLNNGAVWSTHGYGHASW